MIPLKPRDGGAGDRERVKVRRLRVPVRARLALRPSELEAGGGGLGGRTGFPFVSPPLLRASDAFMEPRLPITVCVSSSVSSSSVLKPDAELTNALVNVNTPPFSLPRDRLETKMRSTTSALCVLGRNWEEMSHATARYEGM